MAGEAKAPARVVIVGGGAGGLELAIRLARLTRPGRRAEVTLVDRAPAHIWKPRLHEIATGLLVVSEEEARYAEQGVRHGFRFVLGEVRGVDLSSRTVEVAAVSAPADDAVAEAAQPERLPARTLPYDTLVLAVGSTVNAFGTPGVETHCYTLDDPAGAERLYTALLAQAERCAAGLQERVRVVIVGAGSTGAELAGELRSSADKLPQLTSLMPAAAMDVTLVEAAPRPLPSSSRELSDFARRTLDRQGVQMCFGVKVDRVEVGRVHMADGRTIPADLVVWASGVKAAPLADTMGGVADRGENGRLKVDEALRLVAADGSPVAGVYALGDCAAFTQPGGHKPLGATAQAAQQQATLLARSLARQTRGRAALPFRFQYRGTLVSLGAGGAAGDVPSRGGGVEIHGVLAKLSYQVLYDSHLVQLFGVTRTAALGAGRWLRRSTRAAAVKMAW